MMLQIFQADNQGYYRTGAELYCEKYAPVPVYGTGGRIFGKKSKCKSGCHVKCFVV